MAQKPELIIFNTYIISGIGSFFSNMLEYAPDAGFDTRVIHLSNDAWPDAPMVKGFGLGNEEVFRIEAARQETVYEVGKRLQALISDREGAIVSSFNIELSTLHLYPRPAKTVYFVCHDDNHLKTAIRFAFVIDVFIAHNPVYADLMKEQIQGRAADVFYIPYGIRLSEKIRRPSSNAPLRVAWLARLMEHKGIRRIPVIDDLLKQQGERVEWTIIGDGPEKETLLAATAGRDNFRFAVPANFDGVADLLAEQDVYILPSRLDGTPVALIEAMSIGCVPVISEFNKGMKKIITEDMGMVLPVGDDQAFADALINLSADRDKLERMSAAAREKTRLGYDVKQQARKYFELFGRYKEFRKARKRPLPFYRGMFVNIIPQRWRGPLRKMTGNS